MGDLSAWYLSIESRNQAVKSEIEHRRRHWHHRSANHLAAMSGLAALLVIGGPAQGLSLNEQINNQLEFNCAELLAGVTSFDWEEKNDPAPAFLGPNLVIACGTPGTGDAGISSGASGAAQASAFLPSAAIEERLSRARDGEDETGASSADIDIGGGISLFITGEYENRKKDETSFEDETDSDNSTLTIGADYPFSDKLVAGIALSNRDEDGNFKSGGGFENETTGVFLYASFLPAERYFVDVVVGQSSIDLDIEREPFFDVDFDPLDVNNTNRPESLSGTAKSDDAGADELTASVLVGYDHPMGKYTIGPRVGVQYQQTDFDSYSETGDSGLELRYEDHETSSLRGVLGLFVSTAISTRSAVLVPQVTVDYVHEFEDDRESISASFVEDARAKEFKFETDEKESYWLELGVGLVAVFPNDFQAFANFSAYTMNDLYDSWTASAGVRLSF